MFGSFRRSAVGAAETAVVQSVQAEVAGAAGAVSVELLQRDGEFSGTLWLTEMLNSCFRLEFFKMLLLWRFLQIKGFVWKCNCVKTVSGGKKVCLNLFFISMSY